MDLEQGCLAEEEEVVWLWVLTRLLAVELASLVVRSLQHAGMAWNLQEQCEVLHQLGHQLGSAWLE